MCSRRQIHFQSIVIRGGFDMHLQAALARPIQRVLVIAFCLSLALSPLMAFAQDGKALADPRVHKAKYELASRWTIAKVNKLVFDTSVGPHWLESGDRFWYSYETSQGRRWWIVDPAKKL